jgi:hypothetical protein
VATDILLASFGGCLGVGDQDQLDVLITYFNFEYSSGFRPFEPNSVVLHDFLEDLCQQTILHQSIDSKNWVVFDLAYLLAVEGL